MTALKVLRPVRLRLHGKARTWKPGEVLALDTAQAEAVKSSPLADAFRPLSLEEVRQHNAAARETLDDYFRAVVMPGLTALFRDGRLGGFADDPAWRTVEAAWTLASEDSLTACDVEKVKALMRRFVEAKGGELPPETPAPPRREEVRAVRLRHQRTKQEVIVLSTVLDSWVDGDWERIETKTAHEDGPGSTITAWPDAEHGGKTKEEAA